jgi:Protein of unknown function (DUF3738)
MVGPPRGGTFRATGVTIKMLIMSADQVNAYQVSGGPSWIATERWDIQAKAAPAAGLMPRDQFDAMLRALLEGIDRPPPGPKSKFPPLDPNRPSIFTAIQEQLGLRLDSEEGPADMIFINSIARPSEN